MDPKTRDWSACGRKVNARQAAGEGVVFTNGCFDLLHNGHIHLLRVLRPAVLVKGRDYAPDGIAGRVLSGEVRSVSLLAGGTHATLSAGLRKVRSISWPICTSE